MRGRELISLPVISKQTNESIGEVKDYIYHPEGNQLLAIVVEDSGWLRGARVINFIDIAQIKSDGVFVCNEECIVDCNSSEELKDLWKTRQSIFGYRLVTVDGQELGVIEDIILDPETGVIEGYELSQGVISDLLSGRTNVAVPMEFKIDEESITVPEEFVNQLNYGNEQTPDLNQ